MVNALLATAYHFVVLRYRYAFNEVVSIVVRLVWFATIFLFLTGGDLGRIGSQGGLGAVVVTYAAWQLAAEAQGWLAGMIAAEAGAGTLEHLFLCRFGFGWVALGRTAMSMLYSVVMSAALLGVMLLVTGERLVLDPLPLAPVVATLLVQAAALGVLVGGLALVFKRVQRALEALYVGVFLLVGVPLADAPWLALAPLALPAELLRRVTLDGASLADVAAPLGWSAVLAAVYLALGVLAFRACEAVVRGRGSVAQY